MTGPVGFNPTSYLGVKATSPSNVIVAQRAPTTGDQQDVGTFWINQPALTVFQLASIANNIANWVALGTGATGGIVTLTASSGGPISPTLGNINLLGTANQITTSGAGSTITFTIPAVFIAPGSIASTTTMASGTTLTAGSSLVVTTTATIGTGLTVTAGGAAITGTTNINTTGAGVTSIGTGGTGATNIGNATGNTAVTGSLAATTTLTAGTGITSTTGNIVATAGAVNAGTTMTATLGAITATNGNLVLGTAGNKLNIATGSNASVGVSAALSGTPGTITISTTAVTTNSKIFLTRAVTGGTLGDLNVQNIVNGVSFDIVSTGNETSTVNWLIIN